MKKWAEILKDTAAYGDDFTVSLKDGQTMTLGEMRSYDRENEGALTAKLTAREQELNTRESNVNTATKQVANLINKYAESAGMTVEDVLEGKTPTKRQVAANTELDENDPLVGQVVKKLNAMQTQIDNRDAEIKTLKEKGIGPILNTYLEDFYEAKWEKVAPTLPKGAKLELKQVMEHAEKNGLRDSKGRYDLTKAVRDLTYDARVDEEAEKRVAGLRKKDQDEALMSSIPKPGSQARFGTPKNFKDDKGKTKTFDAVMNDALQDVDLWKGIQTGQA